MDVARAREPEIAGAGPRGGPEQDGGASGEDRAAGARRREAEERDAAVGAGQCAVSGHQLTARTQRQKGEDHG
eukprot:3032518-Prymnesium_polylepis.1